MIKAIVFDLDDTLYDQQRPFQQALLSVWNDPAVSGSVLNDLFSTFKQLNDRVTTLETLNMTQVFDQLNTVLAITIYQHLPAPFGSRFGTNTKKKQRTFTCLPKSKTN